MAVVSLWQAMVFENVALLAQIKSFLHRRWTPRTCLKCAMEELQTGPDVCRLLLCCRWLATCNINAEDVALHYEQPCVFAPSCSWIAVSQTRFLHDAAHGTFLALQEGTQERVERLWQDWMHQHYSTPGERQPTAEESTNAFADIMQQEIPRCAFHADYVAAIYLQRHAR